MPFVAIFAVRNIHIVDVITFAVTSALALRFTRSVVAMLTARSIEVTAVILDDALVASFCCVFGGMLVCVVGLPAPFFGSGTFSVMVFRVGGLI